MDFPAASISPPQGATGPSTSEGALGDVMGVANVSFVTSSTFPAANLILYYPFYLDVPKLAQQIGWSNGTTANGNIDVGIYDASGRRLVNSGTVAQTGTSVAQFANITDTWLPPGVYHAALQGSATTLTFLVSAQAAWRMRTCGCREEAAAGFGLPLVATWVTYTRAWAQEISVIVAAVA